jgi:hypothetical protein
MKMKKKDKVQKRNYDKYFLSLFFMTIAIFLTMFFNQNHTNWRYIGIIGYMMIGAFWNNKVIKDWYDD